MTLPPAENGSQFLSNNKQNDRCSRQRCSARPSATPRSFWRAAERHQRSERVSWRHATSCHRPKSRRRSGRLACFTVIGRTITTISRIHPAMAIPSRNSTPSTILSPSRTFFATTKTAMSKRLLQSERNAELLIEVRHALFHLVLLSLACGCAKAMPRSPRSTCSRK